jgi:predicted TIM-barrel fold metal-dependent hydrolase
VGELRPDAFGLDLAGRDGELLARASAELGLVLLFHTSEPVGHCYPGKEGGALGAIYRFVGQHPEARVVCAHWGGGLPFFALMPEVRRALANTWFDTAATTLLYEPAIYRTVIGLVGADRILFGSDFPLLGPLRQRRALRNAPLSPEEQRLLLGENAARLLSLPGPADPAP